MSCEKLLVLFGLDMCSLIFKLNGAEANRKKVVRNCQKFSDLKVHAEWSPGALNPPSAAVPNKSRPGGVQSFEMKLSRIAGMVLAVVLAVSVAGLILLASKPATPPGNINLPKLMEAVSAYREHLTRTGAPVPSEVSLDRLIAQGLLTSDDVSAFAGLQVTVPLATDPKNLQQVLMRVRMPDGQEIIAMNDGSGRQGR